MNERKLKILYLITKSNWGGAQKYVFELALASKQAGHDVEVACGRSGFDIYSNGPLVDKLHEQNIKTTEIKNFQRNVSILSDVLAFFEVLKIIVSRKPDVLHISSSKAGGIGTLAGRLAGVRNIIFTAHGLTTDETWRPGWQLFLIKISTWITVKLSHTTIAITKPNLKTLKSIRGLTNKLHLIPNGIAPIEFLDKAKARKDLAPHIPPKALWIGGIGELCLNKNWSAVIEAMPSLPKNIHLVIIGEGDDRQRLEELIDQYNLSDRVHLLGFVDGSRYLKAYDIYILTSKKEGLPYVLLEAGLAERPVICSDLPGCRDIIESGETGLLVEPTKQILATSLQMLIRDEGMRNRLGQKLNLKVTTDFSMEEMIKKTLRLYSSRILED